MFVKYKLEKIDENTVIQHRRIVTPCIGRHAAIKAQDKIDKLRLTQYQENIDIARKTFNRNNELNKVID